MAEADINIAIDGLAAALDALPGESGVLDLAKDRLKQIRHYVAAHQSVIEGQQMAADYAAGMAADEAASPTAPKEA